MIGERRTLVHSQLDSNDISSPCLLDRNLLLVALSLFPSPWALMHITPFKGDGCDILNSQKTTREQPPLSCGRFNLIGRRFPAQIKAKKYKGRPCALKSVYNIWRNIGLYSAVPHRALTSGKPRAAIPKPSVL